MALDTSILVLCLAIFLAFLGLGSSWASLPLQVLVLGPDDCASGKNRKLRLPAEILQRQEYCED
jgi:hypothetical protein